MHVIPIMCNNCEDFLFEKFRMSSLLFAQTVSFEAHQCNVIEDVHLRHVNFLNNFMFVFKY